MTKEESINKFIAEWLGEWHKFDHDGFGAYFCKCRASFASQVNLFIHIREENEKLNYLTDSTWMVVWRKAMGSEGFSKFIAYYGKKEPEEGKPNWLRNVWFINIDLIGPKFIEEWAKFLGWKGEG